VLSLSAQTAFEKAYAVYKDGDYERSLEMFHTLAKKDKDYDAAYILAYMYENGEGCDVDVKKSQKWYKIAAHGYYFQHKPDPQRDIQKEQKKLFTNLAQVEDKQTQGTIKQFAQSLYSIQAHKANYFLPFSYRPSGEYPLTNGHEAKNIETEFQVSIKYDFGANVFGLNEVYSVAYSQQSFWQLYADSAYFRETNYNPEIFTTFPVTTEYAKAVRIGFAHESNGRGGLDERSWNYIYTSVYFQTGPIFTDIQLWTHVGNLEYNPDLMDYMGYSKIRFILPYKKHIFQFSSRNTFSDKRAFELNYSYPVLDSDTLFFYIKGFSGYGESLIDYNHKIDKLGLGFSISR